MTEPKRMEGDPNMSATRRCIPVDDRKVHEDDSDAGGDEAATEAGAKLRARVLADPKGRQSYDRARAEIEHHQATLARVRKLRDLAQATVAEAMSMDQSEVSRLERRTDLLLSTLRRFVQATGGELHLVASYPDGDVELLVGPVQPEPSDGDHRLGA
jgi:hypothetical protein